MLRNEFYQIRCCAVFILGFIAARDHTVLLLLKDAARSDGSWQVQEIVAKAFDQYCKDNGYEKSLPKSMHGSEISIPMFVVQLPKDYGFGQDVLILKRTLK